MRLRELPVGEGALGGDGGSVAVFHVLAEADGEVPVIGWFHARLELEGGEFVDVAYEKDGSRAGARAPWFQAFDDRVHHHDVLAGADAEADGFPGPDFFAAEVEAVIDTFASSDGVVGERLEEGQGVVDGFSGENAAVDLSVAMAEATGRDGFPVDGVVGEIGG